MLRDYPRVVWKAAALLVILLSIEVLSVKLLLDVGCLKVLSFTFLDCSALKRVDLLVVLESLTMAEA